MPTDADDAAPRPARRTLEPVIPQLDEVATLLSAAADAMLNEQTDIARAHLRAADLPVVHDYAARLMASDIRGVFRHLPAPRTIPKAERSIHRHPSIAIGRTLYARDGFRCRFCGCRVVLPAARDYLRRALPGAIRWSDAEGHHAAFYALSATLNHLVPHSAGGTSEPDNLVTACWPCNFGRMSFAIEAVGLADPRDFAPIVDEWDGLGRLLAATASRPRPLKPPDRLVPIPMPANRIGDTMSDDTPRPVSPPADPWFAALDRIQPPPSQRLLSFIESCGEYGISWSVTKYPIGSLNKYLIVRMEVGSDVLQLFGIGNDGLVEIPWAASGYKNLLKPFAEQIAAALPGAIARETSKLWTVRMPPTKPVELLALLGAQPAIREALANLHTALLRQPSPPPATG